MTTYLSPPGETVSKTELMIPRACRFADCLISGVVDSPARLIELRRESGPSARDVIVMDLNVEAPQYPVHDIQYVERVAVIFDALDAKTPEVLALRDNFPTDVPHLNLTAHDARSLCLFEEPWSEVRLHLSSNGLIRRIREWLHDTAFGRLHEPEQPLEPLLLESGGTLVIPFPLNRMDVEDGNDDKISRSTAPLHIVHMREKPTPVYIALSRNDPRLPADPPKFLAWYFCCTPQVHGVISRTPTSFADVAALVASAGLDLHEEVKFRILELNQTNTAAKPFLDAVPILIIDMPKFRHLGEQDHIKLLQLHKN